MSTLGRQPSVSPPPRAVVEMGPSSLSTRRWRFWERRPIRQALLYVVLGLGAAISVGPLYYIVRLSLESFHGYLAGKPDVSLSSWSAALHTNGIIADTGHSLIVTLSAVSAILILSLLAGYAFAKLRPRASSIMFVTIVAGFMIPVQSVAVPLYLDFAQAGLTGSYLGAIIVYAALGLPFSAFLMTSFFRSLPDEIIEAALLDGLGEVAVMFRVLLRLAVPALVTVWVLQFIFIWNDLLIALLWLPSPGVRTITTALATVNESVLHTVPVPEIMAAAIIQTIPALTVFMVFQRYVLRGMTIGAVR